MSLMTDTGQVPEWTLGWRLRRSLAHAGLSVDQMAEEMGISRQTISGWLNEHGSQPRIGYMKLWALRTGVPLGWLLEGVPARDSGQGSRNLRFSTPARAAA